MTQDEPYLEQSGNEEVILQTLGEKKLRVLSIGPAAITPNPSKGVALMLIVIFLTGINQFCLKYI